MAVANAHLIWEFLNVWTVSLHILSTLSIKPAPHVSLFFKDAHTALIHLHASHAQMDTLRIQLRICVVLALNSKDVFYALTKQPANIAPHHITWIKLYRNA